MCVSYCHLRNLLYWNHESCSRDLCPVAGTIPGRCQNCRHQADGTCALTHAPLPGAGGCCHWNVTPVDGMIQITPAMIAPLAGFFDTIKHILTGLPHRVVGKQWLLAQEYHQMLTELGIPYQIVREGLLVDPTQVVLVIDEPVADILDRLDAPYQLDTQTNEVWVDPTDLNLPQIFGRGILE